MSGDAELVAAGEQVVVLERTDGGARRVARMLTSSDGGLELGEPEAVGDAVCASRSAVHWLEREGNGFQVWMRRPADGAASGPSLASGAEVTLVCAERRAFMVSRSESEVRVVAWDPSRDAGTPEARPILLPKPPLAGAPDDVLSTALDDRLAVVAVDPSAIAALAVAPGTPTQWQKAPLALGDETTLEAIDGEGGKLGLLLLRSVPSAKSCKAGETSDTVAEVAVFDTATGKLVHAPERVETWRCGAEPGPFFSGWAAGKFVVGWPRGADAACVRAGVRRGGLGFAAIEPGPTRARVGRAGGASEAIVEAGCDASKCYAVALTRGSDPCGPGDGGHVEVIAYPP
jgi:hypothetical protein